MTQPGEKSVARLNYLTVLSDEMLATVSEVQELIELERALQEQNK